MLQTPSHKTKAVALLTGGVLMVSAMGITTAPAQAAESKEKLYKGGAIALGVLGGYWILKGKTLPGAAAAAGAYYAYKKGQDIHDSGDDNVNDKKVNKDKANRSSKNDAYPDDRYSSTSNKKSSNRTQANSNDTYPDYQSPDDYGYNGVSSSDSDSGIVLK